MKNTNDYICFDLETSGLDWNFNYALSVGGKAFHARTLEPYSLEEGGEFYSLMKPLTFDKDRFDAKAMEVNGITFEELEKAPEQKVVWKKFVDWVNGFNKRKNVYSAPIAVGKNIRNFDMNFVKVLNILHCVKKESTLLFNERTIVDLEDFLFEWFENSDDFPNYRMDTIRPFFGMEVPKVHNALSDVQEEGLLVMKFLKLHRDLKSRIKFAGSCKQAA